MLVGFKVTVEKLQIRLRVRKQQRKLGAQQRDIRPHPLHASQRPWAPSRRDTALNLRVWAWCGQLQHQCHAEQLVNPQTDLGRARERILVLPLSSLNPVLPRETRGYIMNNITSNNYKL